MNWGYKISTDNQIDFDSQNKDLYHYLVQNEPTFSMCIYCGTCSATCSTGQFAPMRLHRINSIVAHGNIVEITEEIKRCMGCGKCLMACPRGVNTRNILFIVKKWMSENHSKTAAS